MAVTISMHDMLKAGVHFGHSTRYWNPKMGEYIFGVRQKLHIINLECSLPLFRDALEFVASLAEKRGRIMFVGTKFAARDIVREEAIRSGMPYVNHRWLGGMLTNYKTIRRSIKRLKDLEAQLQSEVAVRNLTKKEILNLMREKDKLAATLDGIKNMGGLPEALFVIDVNQEHIAIQEANRLGIPVIGIVDTNSSPEGVDYLIPGNDDAQRAIRLYCKSIADTIIEARGVLQLTTKAADEKKKIISKKTAVKAASQTAEVEQAVKTKPAEETVAAATDEVVAAPVKKVVKKVVAKKQAVEEKTAAKKKPAAKKAAAKKSAAKEPAAKKKAAAKKSTAKKAATPSDKKDA
jgi:small subunit ribosomal protein S2